MRWICLVRNGIGRFHDFIHDRQLVTAGSGESLEMQKMRNRLSNKFEGERYQALDVKIYRWSAVRVSRCGEMQGPQCSVSKPVMIG